MFKMSLVGDFRVENTMLVLYILIPDVSFYINNTILNAFLHLIVTLLATPKFLGATMYSKYRFAF